MGLLFTKDRQQHYRFKCNSCEIVLQSRVRGQSRVIVNRVQSSNILVNEAVYQSSRASPDALEIFFPKARS